MDFRFYVLDFFHKKDPCILYHVGMMGCDSYLFISTWGSNPALRHREWTRSGCLVLSSAISGTPWTCWPPPPPSSTCASSPWTGTGPSPTPSTTPSRWVTSGRPPSSWSSGSAPAPSPSLPSPGGDWRLTVVKVIQGSKEYSKIFSEKSPESRMQRSFRRSHSLFWLSTYTIKYPQILFILYRWPSLSSRMPDCS